MYEFQLDGGIVVTFTCECIRFVTARVFLLLLHSYMQVVWYLRSSISVVEYDTVLVAIVSEISD